ncbi:MAG: hypothetical protein PHF33_10250, partial [Candidatus Delongbacteria bacterium]|nr:hypothetical protein [Candidatus Delongbacteria bacterium]
YLFMPLNEFDEINEFEDQKVYYWRMKPVYSDLSKVTLFSENSRNFKFVIATYYPPSSISITAVTNTITVSWVAKKDESKGTAYKVYSSVNPYAEFPAGWTYEATVSGTEWVTTASNAKKFYCVTTTGATKDVIQKEVEETVISK